MQIIAKEIELPFQLIKLWFAAQVPKRIPPPYHHPKTSCSSSFLNDSRQHGYPSPTLNAEDNTPASPPHLPVRVEATPANSQDSSNNHHDPSLTLNVEDNTPVYPHHLSNNPPQNLVQQIQHEVHDLVHASRLSVYWANMVYIKGMQLASLTFANP